MPSASVSVKVDKQQSSTAVAPAQNAAAASAEAAAVAAAAAAAAANAVDNSTPIRQVLVIIEHKIRNLEKRKVRDRAGLKTEIIGAPVCPTRPPPQVHLLNAFI